VSNHRLEEINKIRDTEKERVSREVENLKDEKFSLKATVDKLSVLILENEEKMNRIKVELT